MILTAWRIVKAKHVGAAFDGQGARRFGGCWNTKGVPMVYTAGSQALAVLELLIHLVGSDLLRHYRLVPVEFDESLIRTLYPGALARDWRSRPATAATRQVGDEWIAAGESVVLRVLSAVVPDEYNYLLNPQHPDYAKLVFGKPRAYRLDHRLK